MFRKIILFSFTLIIFTCFKSFSQQYKWGDMLTGTYGVQIESYTNDNAGNSYVYAMLAGDDTTNIDVDPGPGVHNLSAADGWTFLAKYDASGNLVWVKQTITGRLYNTILKIDPSNNNLITFGNNYVNNTDLDFSSAVFNFYSDTGGDLVIARYSSTDGSFLSAKRIVSNTNFLGDNLVTIPAATEGPYLFRRYAPIDIDNQGNITIAGSFTGRAIFSINNPVPSSTWNLNAVDLSYPFIVKYDSAGNILWFNQTYNGWGDIFSIKSDASGNVYTLGRSSNGIYGTTITTSAYNNAIFIQKFGSSGTPTWTKEILLPTVLVTNNDLLGSYATNLSIDQGNNIFISGYFSGTVDFDPGVSVNNLSAGSVFQGFLAKYNSSGEYIWAKNLGDVGLEYMKINTANKLVTATYTGGGDIDFGTGIADTAGYFLSIYDTAANIFSYQRIHDSISYLDMEVNADNIFLWGHFNAPIDLDLGTPLGSFIPIPSTGTNYGIPQASFFSKYNGCKPNNTVITDSICQGSSYAFNGQSLNAAGVYSYTLPATATCDSVIVLDLSTYVITGSEQISICQGAAYNFGGQQIATSGTYTHSFTTASGCDSVATLHLTVNSTDTTVTQSNNTLTANANNAIYQWLNCNNNMAMQGATGKNFTPTASGSYKVVVTQNGCSDTSNCYSINITGINLPEFAKYIQIFPNPVNSTLKINYSPALPFEQAAIMDITGRTIQTIIVKNHAGNMSVDVQQLQAGVYFLKIMANGEQAIFKFVKQ